MKKSRKQTFFSIIYAVMLAGAILLLIGLYYLVIKAGIPYQDPTAEMQIQYAVHSQIGEILIGKGFAICACAGVLRLILGLVWRKTKEK